MPEFKTEREEADWWYENRHQTEADFLEAMKDDARPGPSRALIALAKARGVTVEELKSKIRTHQDTRDLASLPKSA